jgi:hypothetical protein
MMVGVMKFWQEMQPLEEVQRGAWCEHCALPSVAHRRFLHTMHANENITHAQVLTLLHCDDCEDTYWKEYREATEHEPEP